MNVPFGLPSGPLRKPWTNLDLKVAEEGTENMTGYLLSPVIVLETLVLLQPLMPLREKLVPVRWRDGSVSKSTYCLSVRTLVKTNGIHTKIWSRPHMRARESVQTGGLPECPDFQTTWKRLSLSKFRGTHSKEIRQRGMEKDTQCPL